MKIYVCKVVRIPATLTQTNFRSNIGLEADRDAITELALTIPSRSYRKADEPIKNFP
jgi:hypothetical protein